MPAIKYRVTLTEEEKESLETILRKGKSAARTQAQARILLKAATGCKDEEIIEALGVPRKGGTGLHVQTQTPLETRPRFRLIPSWKRLFDNNS